MSRLLFFVLVLWAGGASAQGVGDKTHIRWLAGDLPPFVWKESDGAHGYGAELVTEMAQRLNRQAEIQFLPWARAVATARNGANYGVMPLARTPDREAGFQWLIKLAHVRYTFFARRSAGADAFINSLETLKKRKIGVLRGSPIINNLQEAGFVQIVAEKSYQDLLRLLEIGAIDAAYAGFPMFSSAIRQLPQYESAMISGASLGEASLYLAASLALDVNEAARWTKAYTALEKDGTVARLRKKYGLTGL